MNIELLQICVWINFSEEERHTLANKCLEAGTKKFKLPVC
jgi:hypothetical protein